MKDARILVVDDVEANRELLARRLQHEGCRVTLAAGGGAALSLLQDQEFDLVLLDLMMPGMDGIEVLRAIKGDDRLRAIPVIMVSASDEIGNVVRAIELGAEDYLPKPFNPVLLKARVSASLQRKHLHDQEAALRRALREHNAALEERVQRQVREILSARNATIFAMSRLAESREPGSAGRLDRLRAYALALARELARRPHYRKVIDDVFLDALYAATPLLDIGKVAIPDAILSRADLDPAEWELMKAHTLIGGEMLRSVDRERPGNTFIRVGIEIAEGHHEQWDGSGYPHGTAGEAIPLSARIVALADTYESLTMVRAPRAAFGHDEARAIICGGAGRHFDPEVVAAFLAAEAEFVRIRGGWRAAPASLVIPPGSGGGKAETHFSDRALHGRRSLRTWRPRHGRGQPYGIRAMHK